VSTPPLQIEVTPDTARFAAVLRVFAKHLCRAADEIESLASPAHPPADGSGVGD
jgi:hypothetical protein